MKEFYYDGETVYREWAQKRYLKQSTSYEPHRIKAVLDNYVKLQRTDSYSRMRVYE